MARASTAQVKSFLFFFSKKNPCFLIFKKTRHERNALPKPKKSVALSGIAAGNTALCTVGRTGNDLHYRGYDILDVAEACEFEEIAHLLVHGTLPNRCGADGL